MIKSIRANLGKIEGKVIGWVGLYDNYFWKVRAKGYLTSLSGSNSICQKSADRR